LEGSEAVGKSTQLGLIADWIEASGREVVSLREPGGTPVGNEIRRILLDPSSALGARGEALLFMASRAELIDRVIRPALLRNAVVLLDRFFLSTYAYQVAGRGLNEADVRAANDLATTGLRPDLTLLLHLPVSESLARMERRLRGPDRIEGSGREFHERVAAALELFGSESWQRSHPECGPIVRVDGTGSEQEVFERLRKSLQEMWPGSFPGSTA
jgi:dTMP kinase